ncbi:MAG: hypothetical protein U0570_02500 [Phycisphaerales bacterium]
MTAMWVLMIGTAVLGPPFVLWWWKLGDSWADKEHKRFKPKDRGDVERVVVKKKE